MEISRKKLARPEMNRHVQTDTIEEVANPSPTPQRCQSFTPTSSKMKRFLTLVHIQHLMFKKFNKQ